MIYIYCELLDGVQKATLNHLRMDSIRTLTEPEVTNRPLERVKGSSHVHRIYGISINGTQLSHAFCRYFFKAPHPTPPWPMASPPCSLQKLQIDRWIQSNDLLHRCLKSNNQCQCPASSPRIAEFCCLQLLLKKTWAKRPKKGYHQAPARRRHFASRAILRDGCSWWTYATFENVRVWNSELISSQASNYSKFPTPPKKKSKPNSGICE